MKLFSWVPNTLTICNLLCGCGAILNAFYGDYTLAFWFVVTAAVFDFFDGFAARMLKAYSPIGGDLDSLADMVSFGLAPAMVAFSLMNFGNGTPLFAYIAFMLAAFAALRLAKFNVDTRQTESFIGLPTPAMALFFVSFAISYNTIIEANSTTLTIVTIALTLIFSLLMVSEIPMFSFKFKSFGFKKNMLRYFFATFAVIMIVAFGYAAPALIIVVYVLVSSVLALMAKKKVQGSQK